MKNYILKTMCLAAGLVSFSACSDFLDQTSPSEYPTQSVYESVGYTEFAINKLYGDMGQDQTYSQYIPIVWGLNTDCELIDGLGSEAYNTGHRRGVMNYNASAGWSDLAKLWDAMYGIIENANLAIEGIEGSSLIAAGGEDAESMKRYKGEALTIRAMIYFDLIRFFGDIPLKIESSQPDLSNAYLGKTDRDDVMDTLIVNLEEAVELLPWAGQNSYTTERVTKGYAHALLANIALTRAGWAIRETAKDGYETASYSDPTYPTQRCDAQTRQKMYELALKHLSTIIKEGPHSLNPSFENEWYLLNQLKLDETYRENMFEIPMGMGFTGELGYSIGVRANNYTSKYGKNSSGVQKLTAPYFWSFQENDLRRDITCSNIKIEEEDGVTKEFMLGNAPFGIYVGKWDVRKMSDELNALALSTPENKWMTGINCVRMRYSQVLLMYAEVMNELAGGPDADFGGSANGMTARQALELVHVRAYDEDHKSEAKAYVNSIPNSKEDFFEAIVDENAWELAGEGCRKFDLIRWNLLAEKINQFKSDYLSQMQDESNGYPKKIYFNYTDESKTSIDMSSVTWHGIPSGKTESDYDDSASFWGTERTTSTKTQSETNLPSISSGLVGNNATVINRYLLPIASTTISASNGTLYNSYGYSN